MRRGGGGIVLPFPPGWARCGSAAGWLRRDRAPPAALGLSGPVAAGGLREGKGGRAALRGGSRPRSWRSWGWRGPPPCRGGGRGSGPPFLRARRC